jgi:hypothetical protein
MLTLARCGLAIMALAVLIGCDERPRLMRHCRSGTWPPGIDSLIWPHPAGTTRTASLIFAWFSGGGTRAASLAYGALRELARQQVTWEARRSGCSMSWISLGHFTLSFAELRCLLSIHPLTDQRGFRSLRLQVP